MKKLTVAIVGLMLMAFLFGCGTSIEDAKARMSAYGTVIETTCPGTYIIETTGGDWLLAVWSGGGPQIYVIFDEQVE